MEENVKKNNSKRANQLTKDLTTVKQGKATTVQDRSGKCLKEERARGPEPMDRTLFWRMTYTLTGWSSDITR